MTDLAQQIDQLTAVIYTLAGLVVILCCYIVTQPVLGGPRKAVEFCKLHSRPLAECLPQHAEQPPDEEPPDA